MTILGPDGRPVSSRMLRREEVDEDSAYHSSHRETRATGLTPYRLGAILRAADDGDVLAYMTLAEEIEERDHHYRSVLGTRKMVVSQLDPEVEPADDSAQALRIAEDVRELVEAPEFCDLLFHGLDGVSKGYSIVENLWETSERDWWPRRYRWLDPRWFRVDPKNLRVLRLEDGGQGRIIDPHKIVMFTPLLKSGLPLRAGLARLAASAYLCKSFTVRDLMRFLEIYGMPVRVGKYPAGGGAAESKARKRLFDVLRRVGTDATFAIPDDVEIEFRDAMKGGEAGAFLGTAECWDRQMSKLVLGQTSSADGTAGNYKAADQHKGVRLDIQKHDARTLIAQVSRQLIRAFVSFNHGPQRRYPKVTLPVPDNEDIAKLANAVGTLVDRGLEVSQDQVLRRLGFARPQQGEKLLERSKSGSPAAPGTEPEEPEEEPSEEEETDET